jgi:CRISPR/Cas system CMR-associated protein Cmr5 small subunit
MKYLNPVVFFKKLFALIREITLFSKYLNIIAELEKRSRNQQKLSNAKSQLQSEYMQKFYKSGGFLGSTFSTPNDMSPLAFEKAKKELESKYGGSENSFKVALFDNGLQPVKTAYSIKDMEIASQRKLSREEILGAWGVPEVLIGLGEAANRAVTDSQMYSFAKVVIDPILTYRDEVYTREIEKEFGRDDLFVKHDTVAPEDVEGKLRYYKDMASIAGITINEIRAEEDYEMFPYELADVPLLNVGGAVVRMDTGEQLGQVPNNVTPKETPEEPKDKKKDMDSSLKWKQFDIRQRRLSVQLEKEINRFYRGIFPDR